MVRRYYIRLKEDRCGMLPPALDRRPKSFRSVRTLPIILTDLKGFKARQKFCRGNGVGRLLELWAKEALRQG